jgi:hypothetical protein
MRQRIASWVCGAAVTAATCLSTSHPVFGAIGASATITSETQLAGGNYEYAISLKNTGDVNISSFWFGWIAFGGSTPYDFLPSIPTSVNSPANWSGGYQHDGIGSYAILWTSSTTPLTPGQTLSGFVFDTPDTPTTINGTSFFAGYPVRESWVYQNVYVSPGSSGANVELTAGISLPEPTLALLLPVGMMLTRRRRT